MKHLAIIMDGNRRYAKKNILESVTKGHNAGFENLRNILPSVIENNIPYFTVWALSNDNLKNRSEKELDGIFKILMKAKELLPILQENEISFQAIGDLKKLPEEIQEMLEEITQKTSENKKMLFSVAINYGGQDEIIRAVNEILRQKINNITYDILKEHLDTKNLPNPDLIIRTGGDIRHSGFLLFDSAYSEYFFSEKLWPEFDKEELEKALDFFNSSKRNFGK